MGKAQRWWGGEHSQNKGLRTRWYILETSPPPPPQPPNGLYFKWVKLLNLFF